MTCQKLNRNYCFNFVKTTNNMQLTDYFAEVIINNIKIQVL
jgi:hypothetical protein